MSDVTDYRERHFMLGDHELVLHVFRNGGLMVEIDPATPHYRMCEATPEQAQKIRAFLAKSRGDGE